MTISVWGAGGGSGGAVANSLDNASGGGGGGAFSSKTFTGLTPGSVYTIVIGAGGTAGSLTGTDGGIGGASSVTGPGVSITTGGGGGTPIREVV